MSLDRSGDLSVRSCDGFYSFAFLAERNDD